MGDRRWASTRKSGITVLGKVPKPINLPSQRLENHGQDLNIEIVPKGTITWGSRVLSATPNAWGSSASSSPSIDAGGASPNNGRPTCTSSSDSPRPSSSDGGPCPSTAGSENSLEPASNGGSSSRPSSASGLLVSNQSSRTASRPRSAETRPGSSQLSRFAESVADNSIPWGSTKTSNGVGTPTSQNDAFSLSSGDFPTLGSEKNSESRGHSSQGRPGSTSSQTAAQKEFQEVPEPTLSDQYSDHKTVNSWSNDSHRGGVGSRNLDNGKREANHTPPYSSVSVQHQQFEPWHGPPMQPWSGRPGSPYGLPAHSGTYHTEPFTYYAPQMPGRAPNSHGILRPAAGPGGYISKGVNSYAPRLPPDPYMIQTQTMIQFRPGVYPGLLPYDGYFGPLPVDVNARPVLHNQYNQKATLVSEKFQARNGPQEPWVKAEHKESDGHGVDGHGVHQHQYKILLKNHDGRERKEGKEKIQQSEVCSLPNVENCGHDVIGSLEEETGSEKSVHQWHASSDAASESEGSLTHAKAAVDRNELEPPPVSASDHTDAGSALDWGKTKTTKVEYRKGRQSSEAMSKNDAPAESHPISIPKPVFEVGSESSDASSAARLHGNTRSQHKGLVEGRAGYKTKSRFNSRDENSWIKKSSFKDSQGMTTVATPVVAEEKCLADSHVSGQEINGRWLNTGHAYDGSYTASLLDVIDQQAQQPKMKERAKQSARQPQMEEEERAREQKGKDLAKFEGPNRRTTAHNQNMNCASECNDVNQRQDPASFIAASLAKVSDAVEQSNSEDKSPEERNGLSLMVASEPLESVLQSPAAINVSSSEQELEPNLENIRSCQCDRNNPKQKHAGYRRRQFNSNETYVGEEQKATVGVENPQNMNEIVPDRNASTADDLPNIEEQDSSSQHQKKNCRGSRNKNKLEGTSMASALPSSEHFKVKHDQGITGSSNLQISQAISKTISITSHHDSQTVIDQASRDLPDISSEKESLSTIDEQHSRVSNQWKPHPSRKSTKSHQVHKQIGKFHGNETAIWAPVKSTNKNSRAEKINENNCTNEAGDSAMKSLQDIHTGMRNKRADIGRYVPKNAPKDLAPSEKSPLQTNSSVEAHLDSKDPENCMVGNPGVEKTQLLANSVVLEDSKPKRRSEMHESPVSAYFTRTTEHAHQHRSTKIGNSPEQLQQSVGLISSTDNVTSDEPVALDVAAKARGGTRRLRPQQLESHKAEGTEHEPADEEPLSGKDDGDYTVSPYLKLDVSSKARVDNHSNCGNPMRANWQQKSQTSQSHAPESGGSEVQKIGSQSGKPDRDPLLRSDACSLHEDQTALQQRNNLDGNKKGYREGLFKGGRMVMTEPSKKRTSFPFKTSDTELVSMCPDGQPESSINTTDQKQEHSGPSSRRQEALYRGRGQGHNGNKQKFHGSSSKRRNGSHYEYQKIVSYEKSSDSFQRNQASEAAEVVPQSRGSNYRDRDHHYPRRGGSSRNAIRINDSHGAE